MAGRLVHAIVRPAVKASGGRISRVTLELGQAAVNARLEFGERTHKMRRRRRHYHRSTVRFMQRQASRARRSRRACILTPTASSHSAQGALDICLFGVVLCVVKYLSFDGQHADSASH